MPYETIAVRKLTPAIGAEISGVDLGGPLSNREASELHDALMAHQVIFFRDQQMSVEQHKAFGRLFGELLVHPAARAEVEGHPEIRVVHADEKTEVATGEVWHSDMSCEPEPPMGSILYLHETPPSRRRHRLRQHVSRLRDAVASRCSDCSRDSRPSIPARTSIRATPTSAATRSSPRRCIRSCARHPVTGRKCLFVNRGLHQAHRRAEPYESDALLDLLLRHCETPEFQCRFTWTAPFGGVLGQSLRAASRHVRLPSAGPPRPSSDDQGRAAALIRDERATFLSSRA